MQHVSEVQRTSPKFSSAGRILCHFCCRARNNAITNDDNDDGDGDRLHRAGLVEDLARCVMDIVEGTAAAAIARGETNMGPSRLVTLEVKTW